MSKYRVLFLAPSTTDRVYNNITHSFILKEMKELSRKGIEVFFLTHKLPSTTIGNIQILNSKKLYIENKLFRLIKTSAYLLKNLSSLIFQFPNRLIDLYCYCYLERCIDKIISKYQIDILHTNFFFPWGGCGLISASKYKIPIVATIRGAEVCDMPHLNYGGQRDKLFVKLSTLAAKKIKIITAPNKEKCRIVGNLYGFEKNSIRYVPNGVENIEVESQRVKRGDTFRMITVGNLIKLKNTSTLIESIREIKKMKKFELIVVGSGPEANHVKLLIDEHGLNDVVELKQEMPKEELFKLIASSSCLVNCSLVEGMPNVVLEALSLGVPVICSRIPGHVEVVKDGYNGWLFDPKDPNELSKIIAKLLDNPELCEGAARNAKDSVKEFTLEKKIEKYIKIYDEVTAAKPSASATQDKRKN